MGFNSPESEGSIDINLTIHGASLLVLLNLPNASYAPKSECRMQDNRWPKSNSLQSRGKPAVKEQNRHCKVVNHHPGNQP